ncbi:PEP-CTERM sorting domain-containing protein [Sedimentisphaera salicampi]|uniref:Ice-binding protein C-terminal domain-containing protein n=1 Tax=Sedimentisphaera salicampi TaxID=1941349 RepID=A0A1W6LQ40_9BACT|nr:PEP-CTERM sorting domain-containing protein [Sedimentisphaera salicampi]ARN57876.1 hypothetical protein STSP1_02302 [Sedimentisphaera salicampi]
MKFLLSLIFCVFLVSHLEAILIEDDNRSVYSRSYMHYSTIIDRESKNSDNPDVPGSDYDKTVSSLVSAHSYVGIYGGSASSSAGQQSSILNNDIYIDEINASGTVSGEAENLRVGATILSSATSLFEVTFSFEGIRSYTMDLTMSASDGVWQDGLGEAGANCSMQLIKGTETILDYQIANDTKQVSLEGELPESTYTIVVRGHTYDRVDTTYGNQVTNTEASYDLNMQIVPEPASVFLLGLGGLYFRRKFV